MTTIRLRGDIGNNFPPVGQCIWCGAVCWTTALTPFRPDLGAVPLHIFCAQAVREAYAAWQSGRAALMLSRPRTWSGVGIALGPSLKAGQVTDGAT